MRLSEFKVLTFDVYGTLIDWESGMIAGLSPLTARLDPHPTRNEILEAHAFHEAMAEAQTPAKRYPEILATVYKRLAEEWGHHASWAECEAYGATVGDWPAFPDSAWALGYLREHYRLVVLSNVDNESFAHSEEKLGVHFDARLTAEDIGSYKPSLRNFEHMLTVLSRLGIAKDEILHTAESLFHDHAPATRMGLARCWIYRRHAETGFGATMDPGERPTTDFRFNSMADMVEAHKAELK